jgi:S1-C subfamily serine protease
LHATSNAIPIIPIQFKYPFIVSFVILSLFPLNEEILVVVTTLDPKYGEMSVFILCDSARKKYQPIGTTFAVSTRYLLTACHNLQNVRQKKYTIASALRKTGHNVYIDVRVVYKNEGMDWAMLETEEGSKSLVPIPISLLDPLPSEADLKVYHGPVTLYNEGSSSALTAVSHWVKYWTATEHHIITSNGLYSGSSGAPFILRSGEVVAIHVCMDNQGVSIASDEVQVPEEYNREDIQDIIDIISNSNNSNLQIAGSMNCALKISKCPELVGILRRHQII